MPALAALAGLISLALTGCFRGDFLELSCDRQGLCGGTDTDSGSGTGGGSVTTTMMTSDSGTSGTSGSSTSSGSTGGIPSSLDAFRLSKIVLVDPHVYLDTRGCDDRTDLLNYTIAEEFKEGGMVNLMLLFDPADPGIKSSSAAFTDAECSFGPDGVTCWQKDAAVLVASSALNSVDVACDVTREGTMNPLYASMPPNIAPPPCFKSPTDTVILPSLAEGLPPLVLYDAQISASYKGSGPVVGLTNGLITGFIPEKSAREIEGVIGGFPFTLWGAIGGGDGCQADVNNPIDDTDLSPNPRDNERGIQIYLNFEGERVEWLE